MSTIRQERVSQLLYQELSVLITGELNDPVLNMVDVTQVRVSRDLRSARIYVYHHDDEVTPKEVLRGLERAQPFLRGQIAERCGLRMVPELFFTYDDSPEKAARVEELLKQIAREREKGPTASQVYQKEENS